MEPTLKTPEEQTPSPENLEPTPQPTRGIWWDYFVLLPTAGALIWLDTWTKAWVSEQIPVGGTWLPESLHWLMPYARLVHTSNTGTAFSMFDSINNINVIISILAAVVSLAVIYMFPRIDRQEKVLRAAVILQLAGAVGNLISRIRYGHVVDFVSVGDFAIFNVADSCLVIGVVLMILTIIQEEIRAKKASQAAAEEKLPEELSE